MGDRGEKNGLTIIDLANGDHLVRGDDLRLAVGERNNEGGQNRGRTNDSLSRDSGVFSRIIAWDYNDVDGLALRSPVPVVEIVKVARTALIEGRGRTKSKSRISRAERETSRVDCTSLGRIVKLELIVRGNVTCSVIRILDDSVAQGRDQDTVT